ncbi:hypothetical protein BDN70DRAFT_886774, partial [Pholiota conissans]
MYIRATSERMTIRDVTVLCRVELAVDAWLELTHMANEDVRKRGRDVAEKQARRG